VLEHVQDLEPLRVVAFVPDQLLHLLDVQSLDA
jgi:hypothetical protein